MTTLSIGPADAPLAGVFAHQRGGSADGAAGLAVALGEVRWLLPEAAGHSWWPNSFLAPSASNEPSATEAVAAFEAAVALLVAEGIPPERIVVAGFSQGACLAAEVMRRNPRRFAGAVLFSGGYLGPPGTVAAPAATLAGTPVFLSGQEDDPWVPGFRIRETAQWLTASGAAVELMLEPGADHTVRPREITAARTLLAAAAQAG